MGAMWLNPQVSFWTAVSAAAIWLIVQRMMNSFIQIQSLLLKILNVSLSILLAAYLGFGYANSQLDQRLMQVEHKPESRELLVYIERLNELSDRSVQQKISVLHSNGSARAKPLLQYLAYIPLANLHSAQQELQLGHYYRLRGELRPAQSYASTGAFDQEKWYLQQNIASGFRVKQIEPLTEQQMYALGYAGHIRQHQHWVHQFPLWIEQQRWQWNDQLSIEVLSPAKPQLGMAGRSKNENSCVLYVQLKNAAPYRSFLLMGDAGWETEFQLMQQYPDLKADVLILGHHGSRNSSAYGFLKALQPKLAIASAGKFNRYGHPSALTQARLSQLNIPLLTTSQQGNIQFLQQDGKIHLHFARDQWKWLRRD